MFMTPGGIGGPKHRPRIKEADELSSKPQTNPQGTKSFFGWLVIWYQNAENPFKDWSWFKEKPQNINQLPSDQELRLFEPDDYKPSIYLKPNSLEQTIDTQKPETTAQPGSKRIKKTRREIIREELAKTGITNESEQEIIIQQMPAALGIEGFSEQETFLDEEPVLSDPMLDIIRTRVTYWKDPENQEESRKESIRNMLARAGQTLEEQDAFLKEYSVSFQDEYAKALEAAGEIIKKIRDPQKQVRVQKITTILNRNGITKEWQTLFFKKYPITSKQQFEAAKKHVKKLKITESLEIMKELVEELEKKLKDSQDAIKKVPQHGEKTLANLNDLSKQLETARKKLNRLI